MGRPSIKVSKEQIEELLAQGLTVKAVAEQLQKYSSAIATMDSFSFIQCFINE
jgi:hypothetical protein